MFVNKTDQASKNFSISLSSSTKTPICRKRKEVKTKKVVDNSWELFTSSALHWAVPIWQVLPASEHLQPISDSISVTAQCASSYLYLPLLCSSPWNSEFLSISSDAWMFPFMQHAMYVSEMDNWSAFITSIWLNRIGNLAGTGTARPAT